MVILFGWKAPLDNTTWLAVLDDVEDPDELEDIDDEDWFPHPATATDNPTPIKAYLKNDIVSSFLSDCINASSLYYNK